MSCADLRAFCVTCRKIVTKANAASPRATQPRADCGTQRSVVRATAVSATPCEAACGDGEDHKSRVTRCHALKDVSRMVRLLCMQRAPGLVLIHLVGLTNGSPAALAAAGECTLAIHREGRLLGGGGGAGEAGMRVHGFTSWIH